MRVVVFSAGASPTIEEELDAFSWRDEQD